MNNLGKDDFKYLSQELNSKVLDLINEKVFYPNKYKIDFGKFKEELTRKEKFYNFLKGQKISDEDYELVF